MNGILSLIFFLSWHPRGMTVLVGTYIFQYLATLQKSSRTQLQSSTQQAPCKLFLILASWFLLLLLDSTALSILFYLKKKLYACFWVQVTLAAVWSLILVMAICFLGLCGNKRCWIHDCNFLTVLLRWVVFSSTVLVIDWGSIKWLSQFIYFPTLLFRTCYTWVSQ